MFVGGWKWVICVMSDAFAAAACLPIGTLKMTAVRNEFLRGARNCTAFSKICPGIKTKFSEFRCRLIDLRVKVSDLYERLGHLANEGTDIL